MNASRRSMIPRTITGQIVLLIVGAVMAGVLLTATVLAIIAASTRIRMNPDVKAAAEAARIATMVEQVRRLQTPAEFSDWIAGMDSPGAHIRSLPETASSSGPASANPFVQRVAAALRTSWHLGAHAQDDVAGWKNAVVVDMGVGRSLAFQESEFQTLQVFATLEVGAALTIILVTVLALSGYAIRWITRPLSAVAEAARAFGNSPYDDYPLETTGPSEIRGLAEALNEMRERIRRLVDERTRMLAAISHDLRAPLTRIRLRAERATEPLDGVGIMSDVGVIDDMIDETLTYLRDGHATEPFALLDLPSLLQTLCAEYADLGRDVTYAGPSRATVSGRSRALTRALTNIVDNSLKHGSRAVVTLAVDAAAATARIDIADDGPGVPEALRARVFEPFFKVDSARSPSRGGFGLGLTIARDIVGRMGGSITLLGNRPQGLLVRLILPTGG